MHAYKSRQKNISDRLNGKKVRLIAVCARMYVCNNRVIIQNSRYVEILDYQKCPSSADRFHSISSSKEDKKKMYRRNANEVGCTVADGTMFANLMEPATCYVMIDSSQVRERAHLCSLFDS